MLPLDDAGWNELQHAHGPASDTPAQLRALAAGATEELAEALWGSLWHQGDVYPASYAAAPHLVDAAAAMPAEERLGWLVLAVGIVASARTGRGPAPSPELAPALDQALERARPQVTELLAAGPWTGADVRYVLGVAAVIMGQPEFGLGLFDLDGGVACPSCAAEVDLVERLGLVA